MSFVLAFSGLRYMSRIRCHYSVGVLDGVAYTQHFQK